MSINEQVVHGIPGAQVIHDGDLVSLDCGLILDGWWADSGLSVACGEASPQVQRLIDVTREALDRGIEAAQPGQPHRRHRRRGPGASSRPTGYSVVRQYVGHGIGRDMHELPQVPNYGKPGTGNLLKPGYVIAIEPMVNVGRPRPGSSTTTGRSSPADGKLSCYFEHTVAITESGPEVLTLRPASVTGGRLAWDRPVCLELGPRFILNTSGSRMSLVRRARIGVPSAPASRIAPGRIEAPCHRRPTPPTTRNTSPE